MRCGRRAVPADAAAVERELVARGTASDPRTVALYLATRGEDASTALSLAEAELRVRADVFTLDAHAWALAANGRTAEARTVIARALAEGTEDGRLFLHAGVIHAGAGEHARGRALAAEGGAPALDAPAVGSAPCSPDSSTINHARTRRTT